MKFGPNRHFYRFVLGLSLGAALLGVSCKNRQNGNEEASPRKVLTLRSVRHTLSQSYACVIVGNKNVAIRPKITAFIDKQHINEGDMVREGQLMFTLDDVQIRADLNVAETNVQVAAAQKETAELTLQTKEELHKRHVISDYELQLARNEVKVKTAQWAQAKAKFTNAERELAYTRITSPTDGVVGVISMSPGNLITPNSEKPLSEVSQVDIMRAYFSMSERQALALSRQYGHLKNLVDNMPPIRLQLSDGSIYPYEGKMITISGNVDASTGAIRARANFPNPEFHLKSGFTGQVLIPSTLDSVFVIPQNATFEIQNQRFVYVVNPDNHRVSSRPVIVHPVDDGLNFVVVDGLKDGEQIVVEGASFLKEDQLIEPIEDNAPATSEAEATAKEAEAQASKAVATKPEPKAKADKK